MIETGEDHVGLCITCRHSRRVRSANHSTFYLCELSCKHPHFPKYPRLPVLRCLGYEEPRKRDQALKCPSTATVCSSVSTQGATEKPDEENYT